MFKQYMIRCSTAIVTMAAVLMSMPTQAVDLNLSPTPLFLSPVVPPLNMLVVGRDHKLYYEAYNDASDLNGDGLIDVGYKGHLSSLVTTADPRPRGIDYYGYFDSFKCYTYAAGSNRFNPVRTSDNKRCGGTDEWSGDYLNYLTMSRMDALRKVLYGGTREVDSATETVLLRSHIPMDAHSWGKEYTNVATDGYNIRDYTPFDVPTTGKHLFANTTPNDADAQWYENNRSPRLRVLQNSPYRIWEWVSKESPVAGTTVAPPGSTVGVSFSNEYRVRVAVCVTSPDLIHRENCQRYPAGNAKPVGLLHEFGENGSMLFGMLSGSYTANKSGGVLRKNIGSITDEINPTDGTLTSLNGIIRTMDKFRVAAYTRYTGSGGTSYDCGLPAMARGAPADGTCRMWGNPVAEMMYESLKYFAGMDPTAAFTQIYGPSNQDIEGSTRLNLPRPDWENPYRGRPVCSKPFQTVMADINNSYDSDQLPGSVFPIETGSTPLAATGRLPGLDVAERAREITAAEPDVLGRHFIGQSGIVAGSYDGAPTPKDVTSLANIRGLAPEEPTKQGSYYAASVAYHGRVTDINSTADREQKVQTFAVALASPLPKIEIPVAGRTVTLVPFAKSVHYNSDIVRTQGSFQPTNQIVDFYVESLAEDKTSGTFQVNFEDVEAGNDHDMDAIVRYSYRLVNNEVEVTVSSDYQAGGIIHHLGYVIAGTTADGVYLVVQDCNQTSPGVYACNGSDPDYFLDTPAGQGPGGTWSDGQPLPGNSVRTFTPADTATAGATLLKDPLWYAAKWGGFRDTNNNNRLDLRTEWDADATTSPGYGTPDNYFLVTNALTLSNQLRAAFDEIIRRNASAASASVNSGSISTDTRVYQARFDTVDWTGQLQAYAVNPSTGAVIRTPVLWDAADPAKMPAPATRNINTVNSDGQEIQFLWDQLDDTRKGQIDADAVTGEVLVNYLRGDASHETRNEPTNAIPRYGLRNRGSKLGDIIASSPLFVGPARQRYSDNLESAPYSAFVASTRERNAMIYVGANDGMLHGFDAGGLIDHDGDETTPGVEDPNGGREVFAFIPKTVFPNLKELTRPSYSHRYFVDGSPNSNDVFYNSSWHTVLVGGLNLGGQGIYALDITDPSALGGAAADTYLWEFNDENDVDMGFSYSQPAIVRLHNGRWAAVFGNGYNNTLNDGRQSVTGNSVLYVVDIETGAVIRKFDTGIGLDNHPNQASPRPNGMATPVMVDIDGDRIVDSAYAGDLYGNLWKIDLRATSATGWDFAFRDSGGPLPFFKAVNEAGTAQPITTRPEVARGPYGSGVMVLFGTGKFLEQTDKAITPQVTQSFYGLVDPDTYTVNDRIASRATLTQQTILQETVIDPNPGNGVTTDQFSARVTSNTAIGGRGWYMNLLSPPNGTYFGERQVTDPLVRNDRVIFTTLIPNNDECGFGGTSWLMVLDLLSGAPLRDAQLDTNGDGIVNENDQPISGVKEDEILSRPEALLCLTNECRSDRLISSGTSGELDEKALRSIGGARGRQSWRQIR